MERVGDSRNQQKIAGFWTQIRIILWKNTIIYLNNRIGLVLELLLSIVFIVLIQLLIGEVSRNETKSWEDPNSPYSSSTVFENLGQTFNHGKIYYYPSNKLTDSLMQNTSSFLKAQQRLKWSDISCRAVNTPTPAGLNGTELDQMWAFVSFGSKYANLTEEWPSNIEYTIYKKMWKNRLGEETESKFRFNADSMYSNSPEYFCLNSVRYVSFSVNMQGRVLDNFIAKFLYLTIIDNFFSLFTLRPHFSCFLAKEFNTRY